MNLPQEFIQRMQRILGAEYADFERSYQETRKYGLRVNTAKVSIEEFEAIAPFHLTPIPWIPGGYYYTEEDAPSRHPFYYAGLYYLQEPSAMTPASVLPVEPGERVLDLCAAPGGKATALGARLKGQGLLVANDISASRCRALLKNIEVFGIPNSFITNAPPAKLAQQFPVFFDKILVDAPCSGEGMFRKDEDTIRAWYPQKPSECAKTQKEIVLHAADMLRPGGTLLYSTCTFAPEENEEVIAYLLEQRPEMKLVKIPQREGFAPGLNGLEDCVRLWPHRMGGEGHFLALLHKSGEYCSGDPSYAEGGIPEERNCSFRHLNPSDRDTLYEKGERNGISSDRLPKLSGSDYLYEKKGRNGLESETVITEQRKTKGNKKQKHGGNRTPIKPQASPRPDSTQQRLLREFFDGAAFPLDMHAIEVRKGQVYLAAGELPPVTGIPFLRNGLYLGELKKDRFEPCQSLAMAMQSGDYPAVLRFSPEDERVLRYLKGETLEIQEGESSRPEGWQLVCAGDYPLGWGKLVKGQLKNKYHPGWRMGM